MASKTVTVRTSPTAFVAGLMSCAGMAQAQISCNFAETFCGWSPNPAKIWQATAETATSSTGSTVRPPIDVQGMAVANSAFDGFGELLSEEIFLPFQTTLTFRMMQQIFATTTVPNIQLNLVPSDGSAEFQIYNKRDQFTWSANIQVTLEPRTYSFRLKFRFKVGVARSFAGVAAVVLTNEALVVSSNATVPTTPAITTTPTRPITNTTTATISTTIIPITVTILEPTATLGTTTVPEAMTTVAMDTTTTSPETTLVPSKRDRFLSCTFQAGMCAWLNAADSQGQWIISHGASSVGIGLPHAPDASSDEQYLLARGPEQFLQQASATLTSPQFRYSGPSELSFWYRIKSDVEHGLESSTKLRVIGGSLSLQITPNNAGACIVWERLQVSLNSDGSNEFMFIAEMESRDYIAIDEIVWTGDENGTPHILHPGAPHESADVVQAMDL